MPDSGDQFIAAFLISGSGLQDREKTVYGCNPFLALNSTKNIKILANQNLTVTEKALIE